MSTAKQVLDPAFQGAGQKPYPLDLLKQALLVFFS